MGFFLQMVEVFWEMSLTKGIEIVAAYLWDKDNEILKKYALFWSVQEYFLISLIL